MQKKIKQTSGANSEHKHSAIQLFSTLNEGIITSSSRKRVVDHWSARKQRPHLQVYLG